MANHFYHQLNNPRIKKITPSKSNIFPQATKKIVRFNGLDIVTYSWQGNNRKVLIIHGWEGRATNFESIIKELINKRFDVTSFDAPSHGSSAKSNTTMKDFGEFVQHLLKTTNFDYVITHSFGAVPCSFTLSENHIDLKKIVFIDDITNQWKNEFLKLSFDRSKLDNSITKFETEINKMIFNNDYDKRKKIKKLSRRINRYTKRLNEIESYVNKSDSIAFKEVRGWVYVIGLGEKKPDFEVTYKKYKKEYKKIIRDISFALKEI